VAVVLGLVAVAQLFYIAGVLPLGSPLSMEKAVPVLVLAGLGAVLVWASSHRRWEGLGRRSGPRADVISHRHSGVLVDNDGRGARRLGCRVIVVYLLLAAPVAGAALFWGSWGWVAACAAVAVVECATLQRSQQFSARVWRSVRGGRRSRRERATESLYVVTAVAGVSLLAVAVLGAV
jgi:hypothetical protein